MDLEQIKNDIDNTIDEKKLKEIRDYAAYQLDAVRKQRELSQKAELEMQYKGKYVLCYGRNYSMVYSTQNLNDIKIVYVEDTDFKGNGFFVCKAKIIHIEYDNEYDSIKHIGSDDYGVCSISYEEDDDYHLEEKDIERIITKEEAIKLIEEAKTNQNRLLEQWEKCI